MMKVLGTVAAASVLALGVSGPAQATEIYHGDPCRTLGKVSTESGTGLDIKCKKMKSKGMRKPLKVWTYMQGGCSSAYTPCVPRSMTDLNCVDIQKVVKINVIGVDPYGFDRDENGTGCEVYAPGYVGDGDPNPND